MNEKGDVLDEVGLTLPAPSSVMVTDVADPPKVLSLTVTGSVPHVLPDVLLRVSVGGFVHPHDTSKGSPLVVQPKEFLTVMVCVPFSTLLKVVPDWNVPPSRLYSRSDPVGLRTVTTAPPVSSQSTDCSGASGEGG